MKKRIQITVDVVIGGGWFEISDWLDLYMSPTASLTDNIDHSAAVDSQPVWQGPAPATLPATVRVIFTTQALDRGRYWYAVKSRDAAGNRQTAYDAEYVDLDTPPDPPLNLRVKSYTPTSDELVLEWDASPSFV